MLEIRRGIATRSYENTFFREFSKNLSLMFDEYSIDGLLIGNSYCEASQNLMIDALLITSNNVFLIDLKNFGGDIILPKSDIDFPESLWMTRDEIRVKGGSHINPYKQLYQHKKAFTWVYHNSIIKSKILENNEQLNPSHVKKMVCFQKPITLVGKIPGRDELDFFITDSEKYLETIKDIIDVNDEEVRLTSKSFDIFKEIFRADPFHLNESYNNSDTIPASPVKPTNDELYLDQKTALNEITEFIKSDTANVFILQGTSQSGKSHLSPFIKEIAFSNAITQVEFFAPSGKVALNLLSDDDIQYESIYSHIYGGKPKKEIKGLYESKENKIEFTKKQNGDFFDINGNQIEPNDYIKTYLDVIPLKPNESDEKALFIVDEAQLVSNNYWESFDIRFGSGYLLPDFIEFTNINESNRKIIFIGDKFLLQTAKEGESALSQSYLNEHFNLMTSSFELLNKGEFFPLVNNALSAVKGIKEDLYNQLSFDFFDNYQSIDKSDSLNLIEKKINNNADFHILSYENANAQKINLWIKKNILKNGDDITKNDLVSINNTFKLENEDDPFGEPKRVFNGEFSIVTSTSNIISSETVVLKGTNTPIVIKYREISITLKRTGHKVDVLSLENYRLSEKSELSKAEITAIKIILDREILEEIKRKPFVGSDSEKKLISSLEYKEISQEVSNYEDRLENGERVKTKLEDAIARKRKITKFAENQNKKYIENYLIKDTTSKYYKYKNAAHLRFGWALTVHKSRSYKWDDVIFNLSSERRGKSNKPYFKWLYTGLTRAKTSVYLIGYSPINPLIKIDFKDKTINKKTGKSVYFQADLMAEVNLSSKEISSNFDFTDGKLKPILIQLYYFLSNKLTHKDIEIISINQSDYQAIYELQNKNNQTAKISIYCNLKGQARQPTLMKAEPDEFGSEVMIFLKQDAEIQSFDSVNDIWRKNSYNNIYLSLKKQDYKIVQLIQTSYKDTIEISKNDESLVVDMYYDGNGFFTSVISTSYSSVEIWDYYKSVIDTLRQG